MEQHGLLHRFFVLDLLIHGAGIVLADIVGHDEHLHLHGALAQCDLDPVANLYIIAGLHHFAVYADAAVVAGFVGNGAALDEPGDFQILVKTHELLRNDVLQSLGCLENRGLGSGDLDGLLGAGVAANASLTGLHFENAEAGNLHAVTGSQSAGDGVDGGAQNALCILLGQAGLLGNGSDEFSLVHDNISPKINF